MPDLDPASVIEAIAADQRLRVFVGKGRIETMPAKQSRRRLLLDKIAQGFEPGVRYPEHRVSQFLGAIYADYAALRRYLVDEGLLSRAGGEYWRSGGTVPPSVAQEPRPDGQAAGPPPGRQGSAAPIRVELRTTAAWLLRRRTGMFEAENIRDWRGHDVVDTDGHKIGALEAIYVDTGTDLPSFATVTVGMVGRHRLVFVPLDRATVGPGYLKVLYSRKQVKDAPSIETDGELPASDEEAVFKHYGLEYQPGAGGERRLGRR
jgi:hypothetical protein